MIYFYDVVSNTKSSLILLDYCIGGWHSCVVYINEVKSKVWRTKDAMSSLRSCGLDSLWHQSGCPTLPLPGLPTDLSNTTTRQRSRPQTTGLSTLSRRDGDASDRPSSRDPSQNGLPLACSGCRAVTSQPRTKAYSFIEVDELSAQIESLNCRLRHYLARLHRKTLCYSKSKTMCQVALILFIY